MKLSIIIPVYNSAQYLNECVSSLFNQGLQEDDFEILLIDDGSEDSSLSMIGQWAERCKNIRGFHQENQGQGVARNLGIEKSYGKYIMFIDSDDYIFPDKLSPLLSLMDEKNLDTVIFNIQQELKNGKTIVSKIPNVEYNYVQNGEDVIHRYFVFGSMCRGIYKRMIYIENKLRFRSGLTHEDSELCFRLYPLLKRIVFIDETVYFYRYNVHSTDRSREIGRIKKRIESDAILVSHILNDVDCGMYSENVKKRYKRIANSIMSTFFVRVRKYRIWKADEFETKIKWIKDIGVYPITGKTNSWKSFIVNKIFNVKILLRIYIYL